MHDRTRTKALSVSDASSVLKAEVATTRRSISLLDIRRLLDGSCLALRIPGYFSTEVCHLLAGKLLEDPLYGYYINAPKIARVGYAFFERQASEAIRRSYQTEAVAWIRQLRETCFPYLTPIDRLRVELDELWPAGAVLGSISGSKMFAGLVRHFAEGSEAEPHQDVFQWDASDDKDAAAVSNQLAANVYLKIPSIGGELAIWRTRLNKEQYENNRIPGSYGLRRETLGPPDLVLSPEVGELIIFNPGSVHAVEGIIAGSRITWSAFVGLITPDRPLVVWS